MCQSSDCPNRVGATLRALRETRGWKLGDFATAIGISYAYLSNIEAGRKRLTPQLLAKASQVLDVPQVAIMCVPKAPAA